MGEQFDYHDKGQQDGAKGDYSPPHSSVGEQLAGRFSSTESNKRDADDKRAYDADNENAEKQRK